MTQPVLSWRRILSLTTVLVVAAGFSSAPVRSAWKPLAAYPLGFWTRTTSATAPSVEAASLPAPAALVARAGDVDAPLTTAPPRLELGAASAGWSWTDREYRTSRREDAGGADVSNRRSRNARAYVDAGSPGRRGFSGAGRAPGAAASVSGERQDARRSESTQAGGRSGNGSGSTGRSGPSSTGSASVDRAASNGLFSEHVAGLPVLTGAAASGAPNGDGLWKRRVSPVGQSPEPSTLILLGTGLAAAAGALRRRRR